MDRFSCVARETLCPYSHGARWLELPRQLPAEDWPDYAGRVARWLRSEPLEQLAETLDMLVIAVTCQEDLQGLVPFARAVRVLVLSACDDGPELDQHRLLDRGWRLTAGGEAFFGITFAPFYPRNHPRYSPNGEGYVVLQFEKSFTRHGIDSSKAGRRRISERVRHRFEQHGQPYFEHLTTQAPKSLRLVKPLQPGDPPVEWWNA